MIGDGDPVVGAVQELPVSYDTDVDVVLPLRRAEAVGRGILVNRRRLPVDGVLSQMPDAPKRRRPHPADGRVVRRRGNAHAPVRPDRRVGARQFGHAHPDMGIAVGAPVLDLVGQLDKTGRIRETQVGAALEQLGVVEAAHAVGAQHDEGGEVGQRLRPRVAGEGDRGLLHPLRKVCGARSKGQADGQRERGETMNPLHGDSSTCWS